jgi:WD40 repeat protein
VLWDLDRRSDVTGRQAWALKPPGGPSNSEMVRRGIFFVIQRPGTREIICPSTTAAVHVAVVTPRSGGDGNVAEDLEANMDVVMAAEGGTATVARPSHGSGGLEPLQQDGSVGPCPFQVQHVYSLGGHQAPCSWARIRFGNYLFTNSFDGLVNAYTLPEASATYEDACPRAQGPVPVIQPSATYDDSAFAMAAAPPGEGAGSIAVCAVDLSADASRMATGGNDLVVKLWDVESNKVVSRLPGCRGWVWDIEAADDALNSALTASTDGIVRRWDLRAGHIASEYDMNFLHPGQAFPASGVCLRDDGVYYAAANFDSTVHIVDQRMNRAVTVLQDHTDRVSRVMIFEDTLMSCDFAGAIRLWQF